jgi:hypothetical protein
VREDFVDGVEFRRLERLGVNRPNASLLPHPAQFEINFRALTVSALSEEESALTAAS